MAHEVILPRVDMDMAEGKIAFWHVADGDTVRKGQVVFEMETDKATMEVEAEADGVIRLVRPALGEQMPVGEIVAWILGPGEKMPDAQAAAPSPSAAAQSQPDAVAAPDATASAPTPTPTATATSTTTEATATILPLRATPLARSLARQHGIALAGVQGSGENGRILARDLGLAAAAPAPATQDSALPLHLQWFTRAPSAEAPLLLLHGFGADLGAWRPLLAHLPGVAALGIDLPAHGKSPALRVTGFEDLAQALLRRLDAEGITAVHLAGHSLGGGAALVLAGLLGPRLRSLTLLAPAGFGPEIEGTFLQGLLRAQSEASLRPWLARLFGRGQAPSGSFTATALQQLGDASHRAALATLGDTFFPDGTQATSLRGRLEGLVEPPVALVWGLADAIAPAHQRLGLPGHVAVHGLPGTGHLPQLEDAALVARLLRQQMAAGNALHATDAPMPAPPHSAHPAAAAVS